MVFSIITVTLYCSPFNIQFTMSNQKYIADQKYLPLCYVQYIQKKIHPCCATEALNTEFEKCLQIMHVININHLKFLQYWRTATSCDTNWHKVKQDFADMVWVNESCVLKTQKCETTNMISPIIPIYITVGTKTNHDINVCVY